MVGLLFLEKEGYLGEERVMVGLGIEAGVHFARRQAEENTAVIQTRNTAGKYSVCCTTKWQWVVSVKGSKS